MFSSLTSMLPSALQLSDDSRQRSNTPPEAVVDKVEDDDEDQEAEPDMAGQKSKKKKEKGATETLVFVRPPPAKSNHPLNLQVQLVPPNTRAPGGLSGSASTTPRGSQEAPDASDENALTRTQSNVSSYSEASQPQQVPSNYGDSTTSFASFNSASSSSSGRRLIVPLYNLQAHNVMTNVIVDAGTDARVAKFTKRGLEMVDMGIWECVEVWAPLKGSEGLPTESAPGSRIIKKQPSALRSSVTATTPESSVVSVTSADATPPSGLPTVPAEEALVVPPQSHIQPQPQWQQQQQQQQQPAVAAAPPSGKRNVFSKLFSKPSSSTLSSHTRSSSTSSQQTTPKALYQPNMLVPGVASAVLPPPDSPTRSQHGKRPLSGAGFPGFSMKKDRSMALSPSASSTNQSMLAANTDEQGLLVVPPARSPRQSMDERSREPSSSSTTGPAGALAPGVVVLPATLGIQPTLNSLFPFPFPAGLVTGERSMAEMQRTVGAKLPRGPAMYVWIVRKWLKPSLLQNGGSVFGRLGSGEARGGLDEMEIRVEWKRGKSKRSSKAGGSSTKKEEKDRSRRSSYSRLSDEDESTVGGGGGRTSKARKRLSLISTSQQSHKNASSAAGHSDDEDDSDPEDSETPWSAMLKVRKNKKQKDNEVLRLKCGTLSPTPHHPKVVAMLKVPFPLPDVELGPNMTIHPREPHQLPPDEDEDGSLRLSAEEIKDVLCSTGTWVVIKEGFGGIGRVGRKGDGWRIRA